MSVTGEDVRRSITSLIREKYGDWWATESNVTGGHAFSRLWSYPRTRGPSAPFGSCLTALKMTV
jgi:hypothetical protein